LALRRQDACEDLTYTVMLAYEQKHRWDCGTLLILIQPESDLVQLLWDLADESDLVKILEQRSNRSIKNENYLLFLYC